ncbi:hypothetical protein [Anaerophilus nitritogenes]|uniref:hypothetical protein n=1 Tax=Anaerophilus nitritogenes TaxID=2498136 RepID=UPI00101C11A9|nr:hypothetical protein [Anaerophilus nitritogenes]
MIILDELLLKDKEYSHVPNEEVVGTLIFDNTGYLLGRAWNKKFNFSRDMIIYKNEYYLIQELNRYTDKPDELILMKMSTVPDMTKKKCEDCFLHHQCHIEGHEDNHKPCEHE